MKSHRNWQLDTIIIILLIGNKSIQIVRIRFYTFLNAIYTTTLIHKYKAFKGILKDWVEGVDKIIYISSLVPNTANTKTFAVWA